MRDRGLRDCEGSFIVEALVAIALLGVLGAAAEELHRAARDSRIRSLERLVATWEARSDLEQVESSMQDYPGGDGEVGPAVRAVSAGPVQLEIVRVDRASSDRDEPEGCRLTRTRWDGRAVSLAGRRVDGATTVADLQSQGRLRGLGSMSLAEPEGAQGSVVVLLTDTTGAVLQDVALAVTARALGDDATTVELVSDHLGCASFRALPAGLHDVTIVSDGYVDHLHRSLQGTIRTVSSIPDDITVVDVIADRAAILTIVVEATEGARLPDAITDGLLTWAVAGDGSLPATLSGLSLDVHPGRLDVVVGVCADPRAGGTWATVRPRPGELLDVVVRLPAVGLAAIDVPPEGVRVLAQRDTDCPRSGGVRPVLRWDVLPGTEGSTVLAPVIALPNGPWSVRIETMSGQILMGPSRIDVTTVAS
jgi:type II secretory pathway pseudopilin PulG